MCLGMRKAACSVTRVPHPPGSKHANRSLLHPSPFTVWLQTKGVLFCPESEALSSSPQALVHAGPVPRAMHTS